MSDCVLALGFEKMERHLTIGVSPIHYSPNEWTISIFMDEDILILSVKHILKYIFMIDYDIKSIYVIFLMIH